MTTSLLDAFELVAHAELIELRLAAAGAELSMREGLADEKIWLGAAHSHMARAREGIGKLLTRVLRLPELEPIRPERGRALQGAAVDAVEHLHAAITLAGGERSPLLETLFRNLKPPAMRRCSRDDFEKFCGELEKRLASSYAKRMLADASYATVDPALQRLRTAIADWRSVFTLPPPTDAEAQALRDELEAAARRLELPWRQVRLLAEAALLPVADLLDASGVLDKPRRRAARAARVELDAESPSVDEPAAAPADDHG
jgi:hypothetical protein